MFLHCIQCQQDCFSVHAVQVQHIFVKPFTWCYVNYPALFDVNYARHQGCPNGQTLITKRNFIRSLLLKLFFIYLQV
jgi:hypothetical protein